MQKIKNAFKPDVQKEAEARKAAEAERVAEAEKANTTTTTTDTTGTTGVSSTAPQLDPQDTSTYGTGGGLMDSSESKYGATPGHGVSSYQQETSTTLAAASTEKPFHHDDPVGPGLTHGMVLSGVTGSTSTSGNATNALAPGHLKIADDAASTTSIRSGVLGPPELTDPTSDSTLQSAGLPDRSVPATGVGETSLASAPLTTSTGTTEPYSIHDRNVPIVAGAAGPGAAATGLASTGVGSTGATTTGVPSSGTTTTGLTSAGATGTGAGNASTSSAYDPVKHQHHVEREAEYRKQTGGDFGVLHSKQVPRYQDPAEPETTAKEKYYGTDGATQHITPWQTREAREGEAESSNTGAVAAGAVGGATVAGGAAAYGIHESSQQSATTTTTTSTTTTKQQPAKQHHGLSSLFHRDNPTKLQKEPKGGYPVAESSATTAAAAPVVPAAHQTFVKPTANHERHMGIDGPIGSSSEVSGLHGTDARRTSTVAEVDKTLDPSNPALARPQDTEPMLTERNAHADESRAADKEITWKKIEKENTLY